MPSGSTAVTGAVAEGGGGWGWWRWERWCGWSRQSSVCVYVCAVHISVCVCAVQISVCVCVKCIAASTVGVLRAIWGTTDQLHVAAGRGVVVKREWGVRGVVVEGGWGSEGKGQAERGMGGRREEGLQSEGSVTGLG